MRDTPSILLAMACCAAALAAGPAAASAPPGAGAPPPAADGAAAETRAPARWSLGSALQFAQSDDLQVGAIFDFTSAYTRRRDDSSSHESTLREVELSLGARLGPHVRFDGFFGAHRHSHAHHHHAAHDAHEHEGEEHESEAHEEEEHSHEEAEPEGGPLSRGYDLTRDYKMEAEEAYLTFLGLPADLTARVGKFRAALGWANVQHPHALPWVDYPLVVRHFLGHHNLAGVGAELSGLAPWDRPYTELAYQVFRTSGESCFATEDWNDIVHLVHLKNVFDLTPASTLEVGLSGATGPASGAPGSAHGTLEGLDVTYKWRPVGRELYRSFTWRTELLASQKDIAHGAEQHAWGLYTGPEYQFARRWAVGARLDYAQLPDDETLHEKGASAYVTFRPNEYCFWRAGVERTTRNFEEDGAKADTALFLQLNFGFGAHRAHKY
jgi:hypothetical protein